VDINDRSDPAAWLDARDQRVRENFTAVEQAKIIREKLIMCYRTEGVNHIQNCRNIALEYKTAIGANTAKYPSIPVPSKACHAAQLTLSLLLSQAVQAPTE
jgi:hypothetical protein